MAKAANKNAYEIIDPLAILKEERKKEDVYSLLTNEQIHAAALTA